MKTSEQINELAMALAKAQGNMEAAKKDATNPFFKSKYATLDSIWSACREPLSSNGLAVIQSLGGDSDHFYLETMLVHESGQYLSDTIPVTPAKDDIQGLGSALTYTRRYALASIVGITTDEDDDGNSSTQQNQKPQPSERQPKKSGRKPEPQQSQQSKAVKAFYAKALNDCGLEAESVRLICKELGISFDPSKADDILKTLCQEIETPSTMPSLIVAANRKTGGYYNRQDDLMGNQFHIKGSVEKLHPDITWPNKPGNPKEWADALALAIEYAESNAPKAGDEIDEYFPREQPTLVDVPEVEEPVSYE